MSNSLKSIMKKRIYAKNVMLFVNQVNVFTVIMTKLVMSVLMHKIMFFSHSMKTLANVSKK